MDPRRRVRPIDLTARKLASQGAPGVGVPAGGTTGQALVKTSNADYATGWSDASGGGPHAIVGAQHTASGLTTGHVLRATGATTFAFQAIQDADVPSTIARDSEVSAAVTAHESAQDPHSNVYQLVSQKGQANGYAGLGSDGKVPSGQLPTSGSGLSAAQVAAVVALRC